MGRSQLSSHSSEKLVSLSPQIHRLLCRLSKQNLAKLALEWLNTTHDASSLANRPTKRRRLNNHDYDNDDENEQDDEEEDDDEEEQQQQQSVEESPSDRGYDSSSKVVFSSPESYSKPHLIATIEQDFSLGLTLDQLAQLDSYLRIHGKPKSWIAYELSFSTCLTQRTQRGDVLWNHACTARRSSGSTDLNEWKRRLYDAFKPYFHSDCHVHVSSIPSTSSSSSTSSTSSRQPVKQERLITSSSLSAPTLHFCILTFPPFGSIHNVNKFTSIHILHFSSTPFILLQPLSASQQESFILQAICTAFSRSLDTIRLKNTPHTHADDATTTTTTTTTISGECCGGGIVENIKALQVRGRDWKSIRERLIDDKMSGGRWKEYRPVTRQFDGKVVVEGEDGDVLAPLERRRRSDPSSQGRDYVDQPYIGKIVKHDLHLKSKRERKISSSVGWSDLPQVERVEWQIPISSLSTQLNKDAHPTHHDDDDDVDGDEGDKNCTFSIRLDGPSVFDGIRSLLQEGFADKGLPDWMLDVVTGGGENVVELAQVVEDQHT